MNTSNLDDTQPLNNQAKTVIISLKPKDGKGPSGQLAAELREILNSGQFCLTMVKREQLQFQTEKMI